MASPLKAQAKAETRLALTQYESLLVTFFIPILALIAFSKVIKLSYPGASRIGYLVPGTIALATMATGLVSLGIATGVERNYGVMKRLGTTPLTRGNLVSAKMVAVVAVEVIQVSLIVVVGFLLGWSPSFNALEFLGAEFLATVAFSGAGLLMAGRLSSEGVLASANGIFLLLLIFGGMIVPLSSLPAIVGDIAKLLPSYAAAHLLFTSTTNGTEASVSSWITLLVWAAAMPLLATKTFKFD
ncbi:MAG: ABC transporter permease [Actinomycetota bacterium]|nr:ABC transporter permease [Actinomycetota bacterium]